MEIGFFLGLAQEDIQAGDVVIIENNGTFSVSKAKASCAYEIGTTMKIVDVRIIEQNSKVIDRCKRMVVVKKEFSNEEDKL